MLPTLDISNPLCLANIKASAGVCVESYVRCAYTDPASGESVHSIDLIDQKVLVIAYPGTHDFKDILRDIEVGRTETKILGQPCAVHDGFEFSFSKTISKVDDWAQAAAAEKYSIFITGHSKGAAVARRCALQLVENEVPVTGLITFGEPRGGESRYAKISKSALAGKSISIANGADPICWMPGVFSGFRPILTDAFMPGGKTTLVQGASLYYELACNFVEIAKGWRAIAEFRSNPVSAIAELAADNPFRDHHINNYLGRLNALT